MHSIYNYVTTTIGDVVMDVWYVMNANYGFLKPCFRSSEPHGLSLKYFVIVGFVANSLYFSLELFSFHVHV